MIKFLTPRIRMSALAVLACLTMAGCQTLSGGAGLGGVSADPRLTAGDQASFFNKSGLQACAAGALTGTLGCALSNASNKAVCIAIAAVAGCGVGAGANYLIDARRAKYSNNEQRIDSYIVDVRSDTEKLQARTQTAKTVLTENKATLDKIQKEIASDTFNKETAKKQLAQINANKAHLEKELVAVDDRIKGYKEVAVTEKENGVKVAALNVEIRTLERERDALNRDMEASLQALSSIQVA